MFMFEMFKEQLYGAMIIFGIFAIIFVIEIIYNLSKKEKK